MHYRRFIWWGGTRERNPDGTLRKKGVAHNSAFEFAAKNVAVDYRDFKSCGEMIKITNAADIVKKIAAQRDGSIKSLDMLCHGTPLSLNFSIKENENCGFYAGPASKQLIKLYYSDLEEGRDPAEHLVDTLAGHNYHFAAESREISDIDFKKFANDARIQLHGCSTGTTILALIPSLVELISEDLFKAGRTRAFVIGHVDKASPNIEGPKTTAVDQDYRHGTRVVYHNGEQLLETSKKGLLSDQKILDQLDRKLKQLAGRKR